MKQERYYNEDYPSHRQSARVNTGTTVRLRDFLVVTPNRKFTVYVE